MPQHPYSYQDLEILREIICDASASALDRYFTRSTADVKADGSIVTEADLAMQQTIEKALADRYPEVRMLGEEDQRATQSDVLDGDAAYWCLDPVDGTTNFHASMPLFSVSLALVVGGSPVIGAIYDPNRGEFFGALRGQGAWLDGQPLRPADQPGQLRDCIAFVDFKRLDGAISSRLVLDTPYKSQRNIGTCALEWAWLAAGRANLLLHGSEKIWDYAAGVLLLDEAGGRSETLRAEPVFRQSLKPRSVIAASNERLFELWAHRVRSAA